MPTGFSLQTKCVVRNCRKTKREYPSLTFFSFPVKDPERCRDWIRATGNIALTRFTKRQLVIRSVCSAHFDKNQFVRSFHSSLKLCMNARPSLFNDVVPLTDEQMKDVMVESDVAQTQSIDLPSTSVGHLRAETLLNFELGPLSGGLNSPSDLICDPVVPSFGLDLCPVQSLVQPTQGIPATKMKQGWSGWLSDVSPLPTNQEKFHISHGKVKAVDGSCNSSRTSDPEKTFLNIHKSLDVNSSSNSNECLEPLEICNAFDNARSKEECCSDISKFKQRMSIIEHASDKNMCMYNPMAEESEAILGYP